MFKNLSYHQLCILLQIGYHCPQLELRYLIPLAREASKFNNFPINYESMVNWLLSNKPDQESSNWYDILTKADYDVVRSYINEAFND